MSTTHPDERVKLPAAAAYVGCSVDTLRRRIRDGVLKAERIGPSTNHQIVVRRSDLDALLAPVGSAVDVRPVTPSDALPVTLARLESRLKALESAAGGDVR